MWNTGLILSCGTNRRKGWGQIISLWTISVRRGNCRSSPKVKHKKSGWMSKASREIIKHYKKKCARKKSIKFRQVRVNEIEMISLAFYYSCARQQTKKRQLIDHQLSFSFSCAQDKSNDILLRYTNKRKKRAYRWLYARFFMLKHYSCETNSPVNLLFLSLIYDRFFSICSL